MKNQFLACSLFIGLSCSTMFGAEEAHQKLLNGLMSADVALANETVAACSAKGVDFLPQLRKWATSDDPRLRLRARSAIGRITGQWGSQTDLVWGRDFELTVARTAALAKRNPEKAGKPIMLLHLFGNFNEEYC